jgi:hypothetical protein
VTRLLKAALFSSLLASCGSDGAANASLAVALSADVAARITDLQVELVRAGSFDCERVRTRCFRETGATPVTLAGAQAGKNAFTTPFTAAGAGGPLALDVDSGTYLVNVEALDASGRLVANGCKLRVELAAGATTELAVTLSEFTGTACNARL